MTSQVEIDELLYKLQLASNQMKPVTRWNVDPSARLLDAIDRNEALVAAKSFQAGNGRSYQPGDLFTVEGWSRGRLAQMAAHGFIAVAAEWEENRRFLALRDLLDNHLLILNNKLNKAKSDMNKAAAEVATISAQLENAKQQASQQAEQVKRWQAEMITALSAEEVQVYL